MRLTNDNVTIVCPSRCSHATTQYAFPAEPLVSSFEGTEVASSLEVEMEAKKLEMVVKASISELQYVDAEDDFFEEKEKKRSRLRRERRSERESSSNLRKLCSVRH